MDPADRGASAVGSWLGLMGVMLLAVVALGGHVRLSGAALELPGWPLLNGHLLPPRGDVAWESFHASWRAEQARGSAPAARQAAAVDLPTFRHRVILAWSYRLLQVVLGAVCLGSILAVLWHTHLRKVLTTPCLVAGGLLAGQAFLDPLFLGGSPGGLLTSAHLAVVMAGLSLVTWSLLRLLDGLQPPLDAAIQARRTLHRLLIDAAWVMITLQYLLGALLAGGSAEQPGLPGGAASPGLWQAKRTLAWNLSANDGLHRFLHHWAGWMAAGLVVSAFLHGMVRGLGIRHRLGLHLLLALTITHLILAPGAPGVANPVVALLHMVLHAILIQVALVLRFDVRYEEDPEAMALADALQPPAKPGKKP